MLVVVEETAVPGEIHQALAETYYHMSSVTRKPVFGVCDQVRLKLVCSATEASYVVLKFQL